MNGGLVIVGGDLGMVLVFVLFLHVSFFVRFGTGDMVLHIYERWEDHLYKAPISYSDFSTPINLNQHFAEWLVFNNRTYLISFIWTSSRLVLYGDTTGIVLSWRVSLSSLDSSEANLLASAWSLSS